MTGAEYELQTAVKSIKIELNKFGSEAQVRTRLAAAVQAVAA